MTEILQKDSPVLRQTAEPVPTEDIGSERIQKVIRDMKYAMHSQNDAVGIAAPQIGVPLRIFIVSGVVFAETETDEEGNEKLPEPLPEDQVFINPELVKTSSTKRKLEEGCLSVRWKYGDVERAEKATVRAYDENGNMFTRGASGLLAQVFQHEIDHLNGELFIDKAGNIREVPPEENTSNAERAS